MIPDALYDARFEGASIGGLVNQEGDVWLQEFSPLPECYNPHEVLLRELQLVHDQLEIWSISDLESDLERVANLFNLEYR